MSTAICTFQGDSVAPLQPAYSGSSAQLKLVVDNTTVEPSLTPACCEAIEASEPHTAHTHVLEFDVKRSISREDQEHVMQNLKKYGKAILAVVFRGNIIQYAVNLCHVDETKHDTHLADIRADIARAVPLMQSFDTGRELTPERRAAITAALKWADHLIASTSFDGKTVHYAITIEVTDERYHESVQQAIKGDIFMAARLGEWS